MSLPSTVREVLSKRVTLEVESIDRLYLNAYQPQLQTERAVFRFLRKNRGQGAVSSRCFAQMTNAFVKNNKASGQAVAYALNNYVRNTSGGNQADGITVPKTSSPTKCVGTFPAQGATTNFAGTTCP